MSKRFQQINNMVGGIATDLDANKIGPNQLRRMVNMRLSTLSRSGVPGQGAFGVDGDVMAATNLISDDVFFAGGTAYYVPAGHEWVAAFAVRGEFRVSGATPGDIEDMNIVFTRDSAGEGAIFLQRTSNGRLYKVYDDANSPVGNDRKENLNLGTEIDLFYIFDGEYYYAYWVDGVNPPRYIRLLVNDVTATQNDNSDAANTPLYIANEGDLLYVQRLYPVDPIAIDGVTPNSGSLACGTYSFAYRYYNSETYKFSTWSLICNSIPVIQDDTSVVGTNEISGYAPGAVSNKSIDVSINKTHYHNKLYDSIQLAVIKNLGSTQAAQTVSLLSPSKDFYGTPDTNSTYRYTGNESETTETVSIASEDAAIYTAKTIEENDGRIFISNLKFWDLALTAPTSLDAETTVTEINVPVDPMDNQVASGQGFYDEMNNYLYRGYFREEVYRFALSHVNKFGHWARPLPLDMSGITKYDSGNHATTYFKNWATSGTDWKFWDRQSKEGSIFSTSSNSIRSVGLILQGIDNHPSWSYACAVLRMEREKNILGQTPVINGVAYQGGAFQTGFYDVLTEPGWSRYFYIHPDSFDYDGTEDYFGPKIFAMGHAKNLTHGLLQMGVDYRSNHHYLIWERLGTKEYGPSFDLATYDTKSYKKRRNSTLFLYPLEYQANLAGVSASEIALDGTESIKVVDCVLLKSFNAYRDDRFAVGLADADANFKDGTLAKYVWIYSPASRKDYYYNNNHPVGDMLKPNSAVAGGNPVINVAPKDPVNITGGYTFDWSHPEQPISGAASNDDVMEHIRFIQNAVNLSTDQTINADDYWKDINMVPPQPVTGQRGLAVITDGDDKGTQNVLSMIQDPTYFVWRNYIDGTPSFPFASLFPDGTVIDDDAVLESYVANTKSIAEWDLAIADFIKNPLIDPGSTVPVYIGNIIRGLGDDRYGDTNQAQEYMFTGAYKVITKAMIDGNTPFNITVYGGDCVITRNIIYLRDNATRKHAAEIDEPTPPPGTPSRWHVVDGVDPNYYYIRHSLRATTWTSFVEILDVWVESTVNGHYILHEKGRYPNGIEARDVTNEDYAGTPQYSYPESNAQTPYLEARRYFYNPGYSIENKLKIWASLDDSEPVIQDHPFLSHFSVQKIFNSKTNWDRFLPLDSFSVDSAFGPITKLVREGKDKLLVFQPDGIAMIFLGSVMSEDTEGLTLTLKSGEVVGHIRYLSANTDGGDFGSSILKAIRRGDGVTYALDYERLKIFAVSESGIKDLSSSIIQSHIESSQIYSVDQSNTCMWWDSIDHRMGVYVHADDIYPTQFGSGATYLAHLGIWESLLEFDQDIEIIDIVVNGRKKYIFVNDNDVPLIYSLDRKGAADHKTFIGRPNIGTITYELNNQQHKDLAKVLTNVAVNSLHAPTEADVVIRESGSFGPGFEQALGVPFEMERNRIFFANKFRTAAGNRLRSSNMEITIRFDTTADRLNEVSSIITTYRLAPRTLIE